LVVVAARAVVARAVVEKAAVEKAVVAMEVGMEAEATEAARVDGSFLTHAQRAPALVAK